MREKGYYWVKIHDEWTVAEWYGDRWFLIGNECEVFDDKMQIIGKEVRQANPDKAVGDVRITETGTRSFFGGYYDGDPMWIDENNEE